MIFIYVLLFIGLNDKTTYGLTLSSDPSICFTVAFPPLENSDNVTLSVSIDFHSNSKRDGPFHRTAYTYSCADWDGLCDHFRDIPWEDVFRLGDFATAAQLGRDWN